MDGGPALTIAAVAMQSVGKVLYGTFLVSISTPLFILVSISLTAAVFLAIVRLRMPREARGMLVLANVWTAASFIGLFFALKYLPPALFACIEIGMSLLTAVALTSVQSMTWPPRIRVLACTGILAGCAVLSWAEVAASLAEPSGAMVWTAIIASMVTGTASAFSATTCRKLAINGWSSASVLAHRFYLTIAVSIAWFALESPAVAVPEPSAMALMAVVGTIGVLVPLLLLQVALRRVDELTVMICMAAQPMLSFLISVPSPAYDWSLLTLAGVGTVTVFVMLDVFMQRGRREVAPQIVSRT